MLPLGDAARGNGIAIGVSLGSSGVARLGGSG